MADHNSQPELDPKPSIEDLQTLLLMGQAIGQEQDEERICTWVCDAATSLLGARLVSVFLTKTNLNSASTICGKLGDSDLSGSTAAEILKLVEADDYSLEQYGRIGTLPLGGMPTELARQGVSRLARVDLRMIHKMFGVIIVGWGKAVELGSRGRFILSTLANQGALALENYQLRAESAERARRLEALNELMQIANSTLDKEVAFSQIEQQVRKLIEHDRFSIALRAPGEDYLEMHAIAQESQRTFLKGTPSSRQTLETPMGEVALSGRPLIRRNPSDFTYPLEYEMEQAGGYHSAMFVPLKSQGRVIGTINMGSNKEAGFAERELQIAQRIAQHLSVIVEHATLYEESKRSEEDLRRLNQQLEDVNRHKTEFLANMSHELRTPLNAVIGASELLGDGLFGPLNEKQGEYIGDIHESGVHLLSLINDVLDLSRIEAGRLDLDPHDFPLSSLMTSCAVIVRERAASKSLNLQVRLPGEEAILYADERKLKQIIYNLLSNAVKFTPEKGSVVFWARIEGKNITFAVEDTGPGVAEEWRELIFGEFFQVPGTRDGTGLGLAVSRHLVEMHGGQIWLESNEDRGSRCMFTIPIEQPRLPRDPRDVPDV